MSSQSSKGIVLLVMSNLAFCGMACCARYAVSINICVTTMFRFIIGLGVVGILALAGRANLSFVNKRGLLLRGLMGGFAVWIGFISIAKLGIIVSSIIVYTYPLFASLFGFLLLKERINPWQIGAMAGSLFGVYFIVTATTSGHLVLGEDTLYELLALFGALLGGLTIVLVKKIQQTDSTSSIFFAQCLMGFWIMLVPASSSSVSFTMPLFVLLIAVGLFATIGQLLMTEGLKYVTVATSSLLVLLVPLLNFGAGIIFFKEQLTLPAIVGSLMILGATSLAFFGKRW